VEDVVGSQWGLFVDESGDFKEPEDGAVGAGILLRLDVPEVRVQAIDRDLYRAVPGFPWPLHAAHINVPVMGALARTARLRFASPTDASHWRPNPFDAVATSAVETLEREDAPRVGRVLDALRRGERPDFDDLRKLDGLLKASGRAMHRKLQDYARQATAWILAVIGRLAPTSNVHLLAATVLSGESIPGDAIPPGAEGDRADAERYFTLLQCLLGRTCDVLSRLPGPHEVAVHVANRPVDSTRGRVQFDLSHLREMIRLATPPGLTSVRLHAASTPDFDASVDPRIVLADFVANGARRRMRESYALRTLEAQLDAVTVGPVHSGEPPLSHVAASGWAREHIEAARRDSTTPPPPPEAKRWARDQATEWAKALRPRH
jgi:hypothetical protein